MKKSGKYIVILFLLLGGLCCIGLLYLFFVPKSDLFGITYISYSKDIESASFSPIDDQGVKEIHSVKMVNRSYDVQVISTKTDEISAVVHAKSFGYVLKKNSKVDISATIDDGTLIFNVTEPKGLAFKGFSYIELKIPETYRPTLILQNKDAKTSINDANIGLTNLHYTTKSGDFKFKAGSLIDTMVLNLNKATFKIESNVSMVHPTVNLKLTSGKFIGKNHNFTSIKVSKNTRGIVDVKSCAEFEEIVKSAGGKVSIETAQNVHIESSDTNVVINELKEGYIDLTETGKIRIKKLVGEALLKTDSGSIKVDDFDDNGILSTVSDTGDQTILNARRMVSSSSEYGNILVTFHKDAEGYTVPQSKADVPFRSFVGSTKNGKITITDAENISINVIEDGKARISAKMKNIIGVNRVYGKCGSINITVPTLITYTLTTESTAGGSVNVNVGQFAVNGYSNQSRVTHLISPIENFTGPAAGSLEVTTTTGSLRVVDELSSGL